MTPAIKPERNPEACVDCGVTDATVYITQQAKVFGKVHAWRVCSRCFLTRRRDA